jgi:hypothetical protein
MIFIGFPIIFAFIGSFMRGFGDALNDNEPMAQASTDEAPSKSEQQIDTAKAEPDEKELTREANSALSAADAQDTKQSAYLPDTDFEAVCEAIGLDVSKIKNWNALDDWANGARYGFTYEGMSLVVYCNYDNTIQTIRKGVDTRIYERGYEPYQISDYIVDENIAYALVPYAEDTVKLALNYPATADFPFLGWAYGRDGDIYILQSTVEAQNGFGVESEMPFTVMFDMGTEGKAKCVYLQLDGAVVSDERPPPPERKQVEVAEGNSPDVPDGAILLVDGELGEYGKKDPKYPEYVDFYIPAGTYEVTNNSKSSIVMIIDEQTNEEVNRLELVVNGMTGEIIISDRQHIELVMYSNVTLTPK